MNLLLSGQRVRLGSSMFIAMTYYAPSRSLELELHDGQLLRYLHIPRHIAQALRDADSHGRYFHQHIRYHFEHVRLRDVGGRADWEAPSLRYLRAG